MRGEIEFGSKVSFFNCSVGYLSMIVQTPAVLSVLYACVLYFCICTCSVQLSMFHMERRSRKTLIVIIIIVILSPIQHISDNSWKILGHTKQF